MRKVLIDESDFKKVDKYFTELSYKSNRIKKLLESLSSYGEIILLGGAIRDILLKDNNPRDIDLIINTNKNLDLLFDNYSNCKKNRFGGYKLIIDKIEFDIWTIDNHWAFKNELLDTEITNIKYSTFLDFDSIWYNLYNKESKNKCEYTFFNECIKNNQINIISNKELVELNPTKDINVIRILTIKNEWQLDVGKEAKEYISNWINTTTDWVKKLYSAQMKHYRIEKFKCETIENLVMSVLDI